MLYSCCGQLKCNGNNWTVICNLLHSTYYGLQPYSYLVKKCTCVYVWTYICLFVQGDPGDTGDDGEPGDPGVPGVTGMAGIDVSCHTMELCIYLMN